MTDIAAQTCGRVAVITYTRSAKRNAWSLAMYRALHAAIETANGDAAVGAIVLCAEGSVFCAGADLDEARETLRGGTHGLPHLGNTVMNKADGWVALMRRSKPVIAAVDGPAIGLGASHLLSVDIIVVSERAEFDFAFLRVGTLPELGATSLLARRVGSSRASEILLAARNVKAEEAVAIGLASHRFPSQHLGAYALELGERIAGYNSQSVRTVKTLLARDDLSIDATLAAESAALSAMFRHRRGR